MEILRCADVPFQNPGKGDEMRRYYELAHRGFRIVETLMPPGHVQNEHRHDQLLDILFVLTGQVTIAQRTNGVLREEILSAGDLVCFSPPFFHNVVNKSDQPARTLTLKMTAADVESGQAMAELFRTDWIGYVDR